MATATTAVAALKFADTLDITLLTPEQIAKFTEKDFAAFSTQQQVDLTASQVGLLTAKQIAALPFKLLEPNTITGIQPKVLSALDLKTLSADQFAALLPAQVQALTPLQITNLTTAQVDALAPEQTAVLTSTQITAFTDKSLKVLSEFALEAISVDAIKGLTPANIIGLTTDSIKILTVDQVAVLNAGQVQALTPALVAAMEAEDLAALTPDAVKGFNVKAIPSLEINALTPEQLAVLTPKQMSSFTATQLGLLDETYAPVFNARVLALLSTAQVNAMSTAVVNALDPLAVKGFTVKNIKGLSTSQLAVITPEQGVNLSKSQLGSLDAAKVSSLPSEVIVELKPQVLKSLPVNIIANLSAEAFAAFTDVQIAGLGSKQIAGLTTSQAASLTSEHIQKFTPTAFKNLSDSSISALSASALAGLTSKQITGLTTTQLEKMTPAQVAQFAQELKDWAVTTKRYATVESAETAIATAQGIKTGGTVTGTARAETITSGAGADTVTYTGTPTAGDKISTGAGDDSITVSAPSAGAHTIDAGTGTDTLTFNDATPTLTSVTGVEHVVLANTGAQSINAGTGTDNALTSLTATAITTGNTLTLTGSVANLPISINAGSLDANAYGAKLIVTAGATANTIKTGSGNDSIVGGGGSDSIESGLGNDTVTTTSANDTIKGEGGDDSISAGDGDNSILGAAGNDTITTGTGADTINGGTGVDSMTGGTGADKFVFAAGDNGAATAAALATGFDTIADFGTGSDIIDFGTALSIVKSDSSPTSHVAKIAQSGLATFHADDTTLEQKLTAIAAAINATGSTTATGEAAVFNHGSDGYIFISDNVSSVSANDVLIKLDGDAVKGVVLDSNGDITSVTGIAASGNAASFSGTGLNVMDTAAAIKAALENSGSGLIDAITNGKIANITASDNLPIVLTPTAFAQVLGTSSTKVADLLDYGSVQLNSTLGSATISFLTSNASKIAAQGITTTGLTLDKDQFSTLASKLGTTVTLDATGATAAELATIDSSISSISSITNLSLPTVDGTTITQTIATSLLSKATNANVVATGHSASSLYDNYTHIATGSSTAGISGTIPTLTATQFKLLGAKIQDGVTAPSVTVSATEAVDSTILSAISADAANIASTGISASGALTLGLTAEQFAGLSAKLGTNVTAIVDATNATTSQLAAVSTNIGGGSTKVASITNLTATLANLDDTQTPNLLSKATSASVVATDASSTEIAALVTNKAHIASTGITGTIPLTVTQYADLYPKLHVANANVTVTLDVSDQGQTRLDTMLDNISAVDTLGGTLTVTAAQFVKTGFATKLNSSGIAVTINASGATNAQLKTISDTITSTPNIVSSISGLTLDLSVDYATAGAGSGASAANDTVTANLLSKATGATVYANNSETASELASLTTYAANISTVSNANNTVLAADFAANYANLPSGVVVDAANASADNLRVVIAQATRVGSIKNLTINNQDHSATDVSTLLSKAQAGAVSVTGTWANSSTIANFVTNVHKLKDGGLGGVGMAMTATQFSTLGAKISSSVTDMTVDATSATASELATISNYAARVALVNNLTIDLGNSLITNAVTANLIARAALASANVTVTGATAAELNSVAANIGNVVASTGIAGTLAIDSNVSASNITALFGKHTAAATPTSTVNVSGMSSAQLTAVAGIDTKLAALGVTGSVSNMDSTQLNSLAGITAAKIGDLTGVLALNSDVLAANITTLHSKYVGTDATVSITGMDSTQIGNLVNADIATGGITGSVTGLNAAALTALALKATDIASNTLTGVLALDSGVSTASDITTLFDRYAGTTATVNANTMTATQLIEVAGGVSKIQASGITNLSTAGGTFTLGATGVTGTVVNSLLGKSAGNVTIDATGATSDDIDALVSNVGKIAAGGASTGIKGTTSAVVFTDTQFNALHGKLITGNTVSVDAEGASTTELSTIAANNTQVTASSLTNLTVTNAQNSTEIGQLLALAPTGTATAGAKVSATSMTSAQLGAVGTNYANVMNAGITGAMHIAADVDGATVNGTMITNLFSKYSGTTATADVTGMVAAEITALVNDKISTGGITGSLNGLATADTTALVAKISDVADGTSSAGLTTGASGFTVLNSNFSTLVPKLQTTYDPSKITVDFNSVTGGVTLTATQNGAGAAGVAFTGAGANTQTVTISTASTALTTNAVIEAYVLAGAGANTITLTAAGQNVTTAVNASNQTVSTGALTTFTGTITGNSTATDILNIATTTTTTGISTATTTGVDQITLANNVNATMTIAQNAKVTTATGTNTVTLSDFGTATGAANVEIYTLAAGGANNFTLGAAGQSVNFDAGATSDTLNVGGYTVTGTFTNIQAADTIVMTTGANISGMVVGSAGAATGSNNANITGAVTMTNAQAAGFTTTTANGTSDQITLTDAASALSLAPAIETYVFSNNANTATLGTAAGNLAQNVTGGSSTDVLTLGAGVYTGTWSGISGVTTVAGNTSVAGVNGGAAITGATLTTNSGANNVTMTVAQHNAFTIAATAGTTDTITISDAGTLTGDVNVENYVLNAASTFTLGAVGQNVTGAASTADTISVEALTVTGTINGGTGTANTLKVKDGAVLTSATISNFANLTFDATGVAGTNDLTLTPTQHALFTGTITATGTGAAHEKITLTTDFSGTALAGVEEYVLAGATNTLTLVSGMTNVTAGGSAVDTIIVNAGYTSGLTIASLAANDVVNLAAINSNLTGANAASATPGDNAWGISGGALYFDADPTAGTNYIFITGVTAATSMASGVLTI